MMASLLLASLVTLSMCGVNYTSIDMRSGFNISLLIMAPNYDHGTFSLYFTF